MIRPCTACRLVTSFRSSLSEAAVVAEGEITMEETQAWEEVADLVAVEEVAVAPDSVEEVEDQDL